MVCGMSRIRLVAQRSRSLSKGQLATILFAWAVTRHKLERVKKIGTCVCPNVLCLTHVGSSKVGSSKVKISYKSTFPSCYLAMEVFVAGMPVTKEVFYFI